MTGGSLKKLFAALAALFAALCAASPAMAANCYYATAQGSTGPADWQTYCWLDFTGYSETTARSASGQNFSFTLSDGTVMSFNLKVSGAAMTAATSPSWSGSAVGNTAFLGIAGRPIMYQTAAGTTTIAISSIALTPPAAGTISAYMFVAADGESSNEGESLRFQTNGGNWQELDRAGPISGSTYPTTSGTGTNSFTETGAAGTVGAYIMGSTSPTSVTTTLVGGGLQGAMFAVRFASIRLNTQISGARANPADQFTFSVNTTGTGSTLATGTSSGTGLGPFTSAALSSSAAIPLTLNQTMAAGSVNSLSHYRSALTCTNTATGSSTPLPTNVVTTAYNFGSLQFGDAVQCTFTETPYPHLTLTKALAASGRQFSGDQFTLTIAQGATVVGTTTTTGSGATVSNGSTPQVQLSAGTAYSLSEAAAGTTTLGQYTATMSCTNAAASSTPLPTSPGGSVTPQMGDVIACVITNTKRGSNATLAIAKSSTLVSDPVNGTTNPKAIPGAVVRYSFTVQNSGPTATDSNSVFIVDSLPAQISVGTAASPVFTQGSPTSALSFSAASDIRYSNAATAPASFAACTYSPVAAYDPAVRYVCLRPQGSMAGSSGTPTSFTLSIEGRIN
ncbi:CshA/CshB family fibrillar adhesin-related protein [Sphingopyxis terrae]|uniref:CshA/CshB family fibrillar adhesin-related protein n=1 Tax=Sphingopyxis terrae TaxID=33052 RepID=UPI002A0F2B00|nr:CshA/CshB family fibrillar adhesin-related protein [Sphingopyxis terrae]MDX8358305.1 CshA/CshB family fibrillar adhesin-related protein [Sphingopyxis terrae]